MKIKHHPGKAVINDPAWLEMDISNDIRGRQYEANWEDTQRNLSSTNSSGSNSWDKYSEGTLSSKLGHYQNMLDELAQEELYTTPIKKDEKLKYHSEKCLARINNPIPNYYLPSQAKIQKSRSFRELDKPIPKPRKKLLLQPENELKNVINDLEKQMKSVRFDEDSESSRVSEWIDDQNKYILQSDLPKKPRQRIPPRNLTGSEECPSVYNLYKSGVQAKVEPKNSSDFLIPRPKLIVPVHTYAVRRRRTGNLQCASSEEVKDSGEFLGPKTAYVRRIPCGIFCGG